MDVYNMGNIQVKLEREDLGLIEALLYAHELELNVKLQEEKKTKGFNQSMYKSLEAVRRLRCKLDNAHRNG